MLQTIRVRWTGREPLLLHRGELANPFDPAGRAIARLSSKRRKTEDDHRELAKAEWHGSLYLSDELGIFYPAENITKCIIEGARKRKLGKQAEACVFVTGLDGNHDGAPLLYPGRRKESTQQEREEMFRLSLEGKADFVHQKTLRVGKSRILRTRPQFKKWSFEFALRFDPEVIELSGILDAMEISGDLVGTGDWRPRFGTFSLEVLGEEK